jgi:putative tryptophan/tyrosine transport system substrate-binding protein
MRRRDFITVLGAAGAAWPLATRAQQAGKVPRIGYLTASSPSAPSTEAFRRGLRELGYVEGKTIVVEYRFANGEFDRLPGLAAELVQLKVDLIVAAVTQASLAARDATKTIPVVIAAVSDPVGSGLVPNLARPGANVTGTSSMSTDLVGKSLEVLKEAVPAASRVAVLWNPKNAVFQEQMLREAQAAGRAMGIRLETFSARGPGEFDVVFAAIIAERVGALLVLADPILIDHKSRIIEFAEKSRVPAIYGTRDHAVAGGLMTYGPDTMEQFRRAAIYVDRILKGANPADLPVEQPTKFDFVINLKTAKALGLNIPPTLLARADEVIE